MHPLDILHQDLAEIDCPNLVGPQNCVYLKQKHFPTESTILPRLHYLDIPGLPSNTA